MHGYLTMIEMVIQFSKHFTPCLQSTCTFHSWFADCSPRFYTDWFLIIWHKIRTHFISKKTQSNIFCLVLQYCQIHSVAAALFVCFTESSHVDSQSVEAFQFLLKSPELHSIHQVILKKQEVVNLINS